MKTQLIALAALATVTRLPLNVYAQDAASPTCTVCAVTNYGYRVLH